MTTATTKTRKARARTVGQELTRRPIDALSGDFIMLSARLAETPPPVFWAEGELDARTTLAAPVEADWEENYRRVFEGVQWWDWNWYRDAKLADERAALPVFALDDDPGLTARVNRLMSAVPIDDPGPVPATTPPSLAPSPRGAPSQGAGPGSSTSDEAPESYPKALLRELGEDPL